jgi:hypothetical protein
MKKLILSMAVTAVLFSNSGCGTVFGSHISDCQKHKPATGSREVRVGALIGDIFTGGIWIIIDLADGGMYKPCTDNDKK